MMSEATQIPQSVNEVPPQVKTKAIVGCLKTINDGWNGDNSKKPSDVAIDKVESILASLETGAMPWPEVHAAPNGGLILIWNSLHRDISMTIDPEGEMQYSTAIKKLDSDTFQVIDQIHSEGYVENLKTVDHMMVWFCSDKAASC